MYEGRRAGQAGFTLIEAMIAIVVLAFGLIAVTNLFIVASTSNFSASQTTGAANAASEQLESLRMAGFSALVAGGDLASDQGLAAECPGGPGEFSCVQTVPGVGTVRLRWTIVNLTPGSLGITVEAFPLASLAFGRATTRLTTIRTCTLSTDFPISCPAT